MITWPAAETPSPPCSRMSRVPATFSESRSSGTIIRPTTAMTATGASSCDPAMERAGGAIRVSEGELFQLDQVREHFGDRFEQVARNGVADFSVREQRARERDVLDDRHAVLARHALDALRHVVA